MSQALGHALQAAFFMFWEVLWPLVLGFLLSAIVQTVVSKRAVVSALGSDSPRSIAIACGLGAASSSCSYAAVAIARSLFTKGASFVSAMVFEFASTNIVFELGLVLLILMGWQFVAAEFAGALVMIVILVILFRLTLKPSMVDDARRQAERGIAGRMEGHGAMDMSVTEGPLWRRLFSNRAVTSISHYFYMDVYSLYTDIGVGLLIAGALAAWVPNAFWQTVFLTRDPALAQVWGPLVGPLISMASFVCSVGNVPLAAVLWNGGISFGGVISFVFADLIILPILDIYRKYYGVRVSTYLLLTHYAAMALAGGIIGLAFQSLGLVPMARNLTVFESRPTWNYTTILNIAFITIMGGLGWQFLRTGGPEMLRMMAAAPRPTRRTVTDPVCGMTVDPATATQYVAYKGTRYYFCSSGCRAAFVDDPERYTAGHSPGHVHH